MRQTVKHIVRRITAPILSRMPIREWPAVMGRIHDLSIPKGVVSHPRPEPRGPADINILLVLLERTLALEGAVAECGVYRGRTLVAMAIHLQQSGSGKAVYGFDSFQGFGNVIQHDLQLPIAEVNPALASHGFADTSFSLVDRKLRLFRLSNTILVPGYFETSLLQCSERRFSFVHLDCDAYASYKQCLGHFYPLMVEGGIIALDEYDDPHWPGCNEAVDEFLQGRGEQLHQICLDNHIKYYFTKRAGGVRK